jgi:hypothetical protein
MYCLFIYLCCLFPIATVRRWRLRESPGARRAKLWAAASERARQVVLDHIDHMCSFSFSSIHIGMHALILYLCLIFRIWVYTWLVMLSHVVMLSLAYVFVSDGLPSVKMWFDHGKDRYCGLSKVGTVVTVEFCQVMWFVMLESATHRILGIDTPGQHVPPWVRYGMACLLTKYAICCVSCSVEWGWLLSVWHSVWTAWITWCKRGHCVRETSALQAGSLCVGNRSKT